MGVGQVWNRVDDLQLLPTNPLMRRSLITQGPQKCREKRTLPCVIRRSVMGLLQSYDLHVR